MRVYILGLALLAAACSVEVGKGQQGAAAARGGYTVEIRANGDDQVYVVTSPEGRVAAARSHEGTSAMLNAHDLQQALASMPPPAPANGNNDVTIRAPGFSLHASGDDHTSTQASATATTTANSEKPAADEHDRGNVTMNIGGFGLNVDADDGGPGDSDDRATVRLTGLSAHDARKIITDADELSPAVQAQMLTALGLSQD